ncbi:MAG TPA: DUF1501 domain-containing protein [Gemmataceae bacterium]
MKKAKLGKPTRRAVLKAGVLGAGLTLGQYLRLAEAGEVRNAKARSAILVFLSGGPSHQDTFDLKPEAPAEYRGEFRPVRTSVPGVEICEHLPRLARCAERYAIVRGVSHNLADHGLGTAYLMTGNRPGPVLKYPAYGAVVGRELAAPPDVPPYVAIDEDPVGPGYLGTRYGALATGEKPRADRGFRVRGISFEEGIAAARLDARRRLAEDVDNAFRGFEDLDDPVRSLSRFSEQANAILRSPRTREAFDLGRERRAVADRFGPHEAGQSLLLACRLIEAGVRFVTVLVEGWDTHNDNFKTLKGELLPQFDQGLSALLQTLGERGLLASTAVLVTGEFGRTPKVNGNAGRDHWARAMFALMAGGGVRGGRVIGATDDKAAEPKGTGYTPDDVAASFYHNIGIEPGTEYHTDTGRPVALVRDGKVIPGLFGE